MASKTDRNEMFLRSLSMEQTPWEARTFSASKDIPEFFGTRKLVFIFARALIPILIQMNADGITSSY
jgi:hypothetical protein